MNLVEYAQIDLTKELQLGQLGEKEKGELLEEIGLIIHQKITLRLLEELAEEKKEEFKLILEKEEGQSKEKELEEFIGNNVKNVEKLIVEEIGQYKRELIEMVEGTKNEDSNRE